MSIRSPEEAYRALQKLARADGRTTQQTFELYVHERFLARLASSRFAERLVLKGGMLLAVLDARRATRDADMLARGIDNDMENLRSVVSEIAAIELADGVVFDASGVSLVAIREDADYDGVRAPWAAYWRAREFAADRYAARLDQGEALARFLDTNALENDLPVPFMWLSEHSHPWSEHRIDRLTRHEESA